MGSIITELTETVSSVEACKTCEYRGKIGHIDCCDYLFKTGNIRPVRNITECNGYSQGIQSYNIKTKETRNYESIAEAARIEGVSIAGIKCAINSHRRAGDTVWRRTVCDKKSFIHEDNKD